MESENVEFQFQVSLSKEFTTWNQSGILPVRGSMSGSYLKRFWAEFVQKKLLCYKRVDIRFGTPRVN